MHDAIVVATNSNCCGDSDSDFVFSALASCIK